MQESMEDTSSKYSRSIQLVSKADLLHEICSIAFEVYTPPGLSLPTDSEDEFSTAHSHTMDKETN